jgi:hypothetical protein
MPSKPNYNFQRAERDRAKRAAKQAKLHDRKEQAALRKGSETSETETVDHPARDARDE